MFAQICIRRYSCSHLMYVCVSVHVFMNMCEIKRFHFISFPCNCVLELVLSVLISALSKVPSLCAPDVIITEEIFLICDQKIKKQFFFKSIVDSFRTFDFLKCTHGKMIRLHLETHEMEWKVERKKQQTHGVNEKKTEKKAICLSNQNQKQKQKQKLLKQIASIMQTR